MNEKVTSLLKYKLEAARKAVEEAARKADDEHAFITNEFLEDHVAEGNVELSDVVKAVWEQAKELDRIEEEFLKFKLEILEILNFGKEVL